jgi:hypothetical protein
MRIAVTQPFTTRGNYHDAERQSCFGEGTVKSHVNRILNKLDVSDRTQAVIVAVKRGIVNL